MSNPTHCSQIISQDIFFSTTVGYLLGSRYPNNPFSFISLSLLEYKLVISLSSSPSKK